MRRGLWRLELAIAWRYLRSRERDGCIPAVPGTYTLKVYADKESASVPLTVFPDPRLDPKLPYADQTEFALKTRDQITKLSKTVAAKVAVTVGQGDPLIIMQGSAVPEVPLVRLKTVDALLPTGREPRLA